MPTHFVTINGEKITGDMLAVSQFFAAAAAAQKNGPQALVTEGRLSDGTAFKRAFVINDATQIALHITDEPGNPTTIQVFGSFEANADEILADDARRRGEE